MLTDAEKRAARLAVSRYGAERTRVDKVVVSVLTARTGGQERVRAGQPPMAVVDG